MKVMDAIREALGAEPERVFEAQDLVAKLTARKVDFRLDTLQTLLARGAQRGEFTKVAWGRYRAKREGDGPAVFGVVGMRCAEVAS